MVEIGRIDKIIEVSLLSSHVELLREGCLKAAIHVMVHVGQRYNSRLVYDPLYPEIYHNVFKKCDWSEFYWDAKEAIPVKTPEPLCKEIDTCIFVVSNHAADKVVVS